MLYAISRELDAALAAQGVPFRVVFGPERSTSVATAERVVFEHAGPGADSIGGPVATHRNPRTPFVRQQGATVRIFARSAVPGAAWHDHAERAEQVLDHVLAELDVIARTRRNALTFGSGGFVVPDDATGSATFGGAVYELALTIDRAVERRTWAGAKRPEAAFGPNLRLASVTKATDAIGVGDETCCGL